MRNTLPVERRSRSARVRCWYNIFHLSAVGFKKSASISDGARPTRLVTGLFPVVFGSGEFALPPPPFFSIKTGRVRSSGDHRRWSDDSGVTAHHYRRRCDKRSCCRKAAYLFIGGQGRRSRSLDSGWRGGGIIAATMASIAREINNDNIRCGFT